MNSILMRNLRVLLALALVAIAASGCSKAARLQRAIATADRLFQAGDYPKAEVAYSNALRIVFPPDPAAIRGLGMVYYEEGRTMDAMSVLYQAAKRDPNNARCQSELASLLALNGVFQQAKDAAHIALKLNPGDEKALTALCLCARNPQEAEQVRHYIEQLQAHDQDRASYHVSLASLDAIENKMKEAEAELNKAKVLDPNSSLVYLGFAGLANYYNNVKGADEAQQSALKFSPLRSPVRVNYAEFLVQNHRTNEAKTNMLELVRQAPDYIPAYLFLMKRAFAEQKYDDCLSYVSEVLAREPNNFDALLTKGEVSMVKKDGKQAVADFSRVWRIYSKMNRPQIPYQLASAYVLAGDRNKAITVLNQALQIDTNFIPTKLLLAELYVRQGNPDTAISLLPPLLARTNLPQSVVVPGSLLLAEAYVMQNSTAEAIGIYRRLEKFFTNEAQPFFLEGQAWAMDRKNPEAVRAYNKALEINPDFGPALEGAVNAEMAGGREQDALQRVKKYIEKDPKQSLPWLLQAEIHLRLRDNSAAQTDLETVISLDPKLPFPYLMLARLYVDQHKQQEALDRLNVLVGLTNNVSALMQIGMIHDAMGHYQPAKDSYEKLLKVNPMFGAALNNLAYLYSEHFNNVDKAKEVAEQARELYPADPYVADTLGWILYKKHDYSRALALVEESMDRQPNDGEIHYHVGMAQYMLGQEGPARVNLKFALSKMNFNATNDALTHFRILAINPTNAAAEDRSELAAHLKDEPNDPVALACLAGIQEHDGEFAKAAATYEKAMDLIPDNARLILRLALLDSTSLNQPAKALELAKRASNLAPDDPVIAAALGRMDFQAHDYLHARDLLDSAARLLPAQPDVQHDLAWADFSVGQISDAQIAMQNAVQSGGPFPKLPDARQFLQMLSVCANPAQPDAAANVRHVLQADANYAPALLASCVLEEHQGHLKEAAAACEKLLATYPQCAAALRLLAIVGAEDGSDDTKAYANAMKALESFPDDPGLNKAKGMIEYRRKDYNKSLQSLDITAAKDRNDAELMWYMGMDQYYLKQTNDAKKTLTMAVNSKLPKPLDDQAKTVLIQLH